MRLRDLLQHPSIKGVCIGCCVGGDRIANSNAAHAHYGGRFAGWICIDSLRFLTATTIRHETAHILRANPKHDEAWRKQVRALGGHVEARYKN